MGFKFAGKETQTSDFRVDKEFFINRSKASSQGKVNGLDVDQLGKVIVSPKAISGIALVDDTAAIIQSKLEAGILTITPTADRIKTTPTAAQIIEQFGFTEFYQNADIPIINLASKDFSLTLNAGTGVTLVGDMTIYPKSSAFFRFIVSNADVDEVTIYRIAGNDKHFLEQSAVKILPSDFIPDDGGRPLAIDDTGVASEELFLETASTNTAYATVDIPIGYKATAVMIFGSGTTGVEVWEHQLNSKTGVSKGTGNVGTLIDITDVTSSFSLVSGGNYLFIQVLQGSGDEIYGGYVTLATT